jgi:hypothetical protein
VRLLKRKGEVQIHGVHYRLQGETAVIHYAHAALASQLPTQIKTELATVKVILLADSIRSRLLAWFGSPIIKKIPEYHPPNVYGYVEI